MSDSTCPTCGQHIQDTETCPDCHGAVSALEPALAKTLATTAIAAAEYPVQARIVGTDSSFRASPPPESTPLPSIRRGPLWWVMRPATMILAAAIELMSAALLVPKV